MNVAALEPVTTLRIVNPDPKYKPARLIAPTTLGYIHIAAAVRPSPIPPVLPSVERTSVLVRLKELAHRLEHLDDVVKATVYRGIVMPPTARFSSYLKERGDAIHL